MSFYITLPSNTIAKRENFTGDFRVDLAHTVELEGEWEVALASIQYPYTWDNFVNQTLIVYTESASFVVSLPNSHYENIYQLVAGLNGSYYDAVNDNAKALTPKGKSTYDFVQKYVKAVKFVYNEVIKRVTITVTEVKAVHLNEHLHYTLGFHEKLTKFTEGMYKAEFPPDFTAGFTSLFVYTDIIRPQMVGGIEAQLLRIVPIKGNYGEIVAKDYDSLHYVELLNKRFDSISLAIKDDSDTPVKFLYGKAVIKLHFRRKRFF